MFVVDVNDVPSHEPLFLFRNGNVVFLVSETNYDTFCQTDSNSERDRLADMVITLPETNHGGVYRGPKPQVVKSRHF